MDGTMKGKLMIQGTMSGVGKSILTAGLCRIFAGDGYRVAPFKSQNMALNSCVTEEGLEMGRAQALQACAAVEKPSVDMNPILLKPVSDGCSEVILNGKTEGIMPAAEYFARKKDYIPLIRESFARLSDSHDIIVIEGAGSPAEINLKENDIVNMGLADLVDSPVLLAGDIDRGGVFAQLVGTMELLTPKERSRVKGFLINKFRGDPKLLQPGLRMLEKRTGKPVLGVIPFLELDLEDEDSLSERLRNREDHGERSGLISIAVIRFPKISNFTDFQLLSKASPFRLYYVDHPRELKHPDLILLPGTRDTMGDLRWLSDTGLKDAVCEAHREGSLVFGICGGYQMLGKSLADPSEGKSPGLGLLPVSTVFQENKIRRNVEGTILSSRGALALLEGMACRGYEIHTGATVLEAGACPFIRKNGTAGGNDAGGGETDGCIAEDGTVCGTYFHGIFDDKDMVQRLADILLKRRGLPTQDVEILSLPEIREEELDKLAGALRESIDLPSVYRIMSH